VLVEAGPDHLDVRTLPRDAVTVDPEDLSARRGFQDGIVTKVDRTSDRRREGLRRSENGRRTRRTRSTLDEHCTHRHQERLRLPLSKNRRRPKALPKKAPIRAVYRSADAHPNVWTRWRSPGEYARYGHDSSSAVLALDIGNGSCGVA
jgi:hypothetical protein